MRDCDCSGRRQFLRLGALTLLVSAVSPSLARAAGDLALGRRRRAAAGKTLVYVFQRFGADGLNIVVPTEPGEHAIYRGFRPFLAVPSGTAGLGDLNGDFALHPLCQDGLYRLWRAGQVAILPDVGYPNGSRSHFDGQLYLDLGTPDVKTTRDGWLNRYLQASAGPQGPLRAISWSQSVPPSLEGPASALALTDVASLAVTQQDAGRNDRILAAYERSYAEPPAGRDHDPELHAAGQGLLAAIRTIPRPLPAPTVAYPSGDFARALMQLAQLIRTDLVEIEVAQIDFGGWDHHADQQTSLTTGRFPQLLSQFSDAIAAFSDDLGPARMADICILTASEFGRTTRENGARGTDHGSGWASFVIGGGVRPGIYHGPNGWYGLSDLRDGRDLKHSLDFRDLFAEVLAGHLGTFSPGIFPGWTRTPIGLW